MNIEKNKSMYQVAIQALNSLQTNAQVLQKLKLSNNFGQENNIEETKKYLLRTGLSVDELESKLSVIHVSGTKGKGSTCAFCESILRHHGYKTGFYSSPHLVAVRERIRINHSPISESAFSKYFWMVYNKLFATKEHDNDMPSYFKFLTIMALNVFVAEKVDVAVIEVGIGGEYDCTNIFRNTAVVGISSLGLDHTKLLGHTIEEIAWQKGGIMKPGALAFTSPQTPTALQVLSDRADEKQCRLMVVPPLEEYSWPSRHISVGIGGDVQAVNASLALQLAHAWINHTHPDNQRGAKLFGKAKAFEIDQNTAQGLVNCTWPGRYQVLKRKFIHGTFTFYLDGAHTRESIELCAQWFNDSTDGLASRKPVHHTLIYNLTGYRDTTDLLTPLVTCHFNSVYFCPNLLDADIKTPDSINLTVTSEHQMARCKENMETWLALTGETQVEEVKTFQSVNDTLAHVQSREGEHRILVTGSLHLVGAVLTALDPTLAINS